MYYFGSGATIPAISRKIIESDLIEKYHWLPQDLAKIPYKELQYHLMIQKHRNAQVQNKIQTEKVKQSIVSSGKGGMKTFVREI